MNDTNNPQKNDPTVTFETQCWENDYDYILTGDRLRASIAHCNFPFTKRQLIINKVYNRNKVTALAEECKQKGIIDAYYFAEDYIDRVLRHFAISRSSFKGGYYYSRCQLVGLFLCDTDYLVHFTTDSMIEKENTSHWIAEGAALMDANRKYVCANPSWSITRNGITFGREGAKDEAMNEDGDWYVSFGFSDNCYMVPVQLFRQRIYNEYNKASDRFPVYSGECFEKRVDSFMRNHELMRLSNKHIWYSHTNFPKKRLVKFFGIWGKLQTNIRLYKKIIRIKLKGAGL